ncbi:MAG: biotin/lipoyl-binding protein, partial [Sphingomonadaceae bacterium]|nr:biotin/lipoyl-binding protein [Sphingomonadaceae bacterium]
MMTGMNMHSAIDDTLPARSRFRPVRRGWRVPAIAASIVAVVAIGLWLVLGRAKPVPPPAPATVPTVSVVVPGTSRVAADITATGSIAARRDSVVGVNGEGGVVTAVLVDAGQRVAKGQVLARIDSSVQAQQVAQMAAAIRSARADA